MQPWPQIKPSVWDFHTANFPARLSKRIPQLGKANDAGYKVKKPCHAFRVLYAPRRHQHGVDIETLRQELGPSDITTTQIYLRSTNTKSDRHRARINEADRFSIAATCKPFLHHAGTDPSTKKRDCLYPIMDI
jgi:hypothetical protein